MKAAKIILGIAVVGVLIYVAGVMGLVWLVTPTV